MQNFQGNHRFRGYRQSSKLVEFLKATPCDYHDVLFQQVVNEKLIEEQLGPLMDDLAETQVSQVQRLRVQLRYRLKNTST